MTSHLSGSLRRGVRTGRPSRPWLQYAVGRASRLGMPAISSVREHSVSDNMQPTDDRNDVADRGGPERRHRDRLTASVATLIDQVHPNRIKQRSVDQLKRLANAEREREVAGLQRSRRSSHGPPGGAGRRRGRFGRFRPDHPGIGGAPREVRRSDVRLDRVSEGGAWPIRMLHDRVLVSTEVSRGAAEERAGS